MERFALVIDGKSVQTADHFEVLNPSTGAVAYFGAPGNRQDCIHRILSHRSESDVVGCTNAEAPYPRTRRQ